MYGIVFMTAMHFIYSWATWLWRLIREIFYKKKKKIVSLCSFKWLWSGLYQCSTVTYIWNVCTTGLRLHCWKHSFCINNHNAILCMRLLKQKWIHILNEGGMMRGDTWSDLINLKLLNVRIVKLSWNCEINVKIGWNDWINVKVFRRRNCLLVNVQLWDKCQT